MDNPIEQEWQTFYSTVFGKGMSDQQYVDLRRTFYAGAAAFYGLVMTMLSSEEEPTEADIDRMKALHDELGDFAAAVRERRS